jgi:methyl-accepting chemotaxis protein
MKNRVIDLPYIGKDTYNINILQLKNDKKLLKLYFQNIESFINSFDDNKKLLKKIIKELDKYSPMDHPFCFLKKFQIILNLQYLYFDNFLEKSHKSFEHLKESINSNLTMISQFLSNIQEISDNIKLNSDFMNKQNELILSSFEQTEKVIVEDYLKLNKRINKSKDNKNMISKEQLINE